MSPCARIFMIYCIMDMKCLRVYIAWNDNDMNSSDESKKDKETCLCPMTFHNENKVNNTTFELTYNELFHIHKKLD